VNTQYIGLHLCIIDYYLCNDLNWYNYVLIWVVTQIFIASWQLLNIYLVPPVNEAGKTIRLPIEDGFVSPLLTTSYNPLRISQCINF